MRLGFRLNQEQTHKLIMTPELRQAITILQLSAVELTQYIEQELLENPVLEIREDSDEETAGEEARSDGEEKFDIDWQEYFQDKSDLGYQAASDNEENRFENFYTEAPTLHEHLLFQLGMQGLDKTEHKIGEFLIGNIDEKGYLQCTVEETVERYKVSTDTVEKVLHIIQGFDPSGVGARNLRECLLIQLDQQGIYNPLLEQIINHHLNNLAESGLNKVAQALKVSVREVQAAADLLKTLDPKPGRKFGNPRDVRYIVPDIVVERVNMEYVILVNDTMLPRLRINHSYRDILAAEGSDQEARKFIEGKLNSASWLVKSIEQRRFTLFKVAQAIVDFQREFFDRGISHLKPLNLKQVASHIGLHESTVSRAASGKYIQTPWGVFEMKYFFASGIENTGGNSTSSQSIKKLIRELLQSEDIKKPLSDQKIAESLQQRGINISRRTVAKYRDEMGVASAARRKRY